MTGTALSGSLKVNDNVEIPSLKEVKKVKSMQVFRKPVDKIRGGDRAGVCVTQFDPTLLERGVVCHPNSLQPIYAAVVNAEKIGYFKGRIETKMKFLVSIGYEASNARCRFFSCAKSPCSCPETGFNFDQEYGHCDGLNGRCESNIM